MNKRMDKWMRSEWMDGLREGGMKGGADEWIN